MGEKKTQKIVTPGRLSKIVERLKRTGKKIVLCHGVFDLLHPGHIRHFKSAKSYGDILIVTITADRFINKGPGRPFFNQNLRSEVLAAIQQIDFVAIVNCASAVEPIKLIKPHYYAKGPDYKNRKVIANLPRKLNDEEEAILSVKGQLIFTDDEVVYSSSGLINEFLENYPPKTKRFLENFKQKYPASVITDKLNTVKNIKVLVVGDAIIDQYYYCLPMGRSSKEPIMVHRYVREESFTGGALATANHLTSLVENVTLVTILGKKKSFKNFILRRLKNSINPEFFYQTANTIIKRRFLDAFTKQKLFQITYIKDEMTEAKTEKKILQYLRENIKKFDFVIVNDFGHGLLTHNIIRMLIQKANFLALNVQANSANYGFNIVTKYKRADFVCIDEQEIRLATHDKYGDLKMLIQKIYKKMKCKYMIITRGSEGAISYSGGNNFFETPALTDKIVDRVGAGDALFAICAPCVYKDMEKDLIPFIGNVAGALQVQTVGNKKPIEFADLVKYITRLLK